MRVRLRCEIAQASVTQARINLDNTQVQSARYFELEKKKVISTAEARYHARQTGSGAKASWSVPTQISNGQSNSLARRVPIIPESRLPLQHLARLNSTWSGLNLYASAPGTVVDLQVAHGTYAKAGQSLMTFVSFEDVWVEAYLTENNLARISVGDPVEITLDLYPGRIFDGVVSSFSIGASVGAQMAGALPKPPEIDGWMRDPQRFPVRIRMLGYETGSEATDIRRILNGQADVIVYTGDNWLMNGLGAAWIRLMSWLSYAY